MDNVATALDSYAQHLLAACVTSLASSWAGRAPVDEALDIYSLADVWQEAVVADGEVELADDVSGTRCAAMSRLCDAQATVEASEGIGDLYLCLGYIALPVTDARKGKARVNLYRSPIVLAPAQVRRCETGGTAKYLLRATGAPFANPLVLLGLRSGLGVELPACSREWQGGISSYLDEVERLVTTAPGRSASQAPVEGADTEMVEFWSMKRQAGLLQVPGPALAQFRDLSSHGARIGSNPLTGWVLARAGGLEAEDTESAASEPRVVELGAAGDSAADADLLKGDESFVLQVPPGDREALVAAAADLVARRVRSGKRVLFCAADGGVREAVARRLDESASVPSKLDLLDEASARSALEGARAGAEGTDGAQGCPVEPLHVTLGAARGRLEHLAGADRPQGQPLGEALASSIGSMEAADLRDRLEALSSLADAARRFPEGVEKCPWYGARVETVDHDFRAEARTRLDELNLKAKQANITYQTMERETGLEFSPTTEALGEAAALFDHVLARPAIPQVWGLDTDFAELERVRAAWEQRSASLIERVHELHDRAVEVLGSAADGDPSAQSPDVAAEEPPEDGSADAAVPAPPDEAGGAPAPAAPSKEAPLVGDVSERPGYLDAEPDVEHLRASAAIDRYAKLVGSAVARRIAEDPCYSNWAASRIEDVRATYDLLEQFVGAHANLRAMILRDYAEGVLSVDHEQMESRFPPEGASWFKRFFNFAHRRDLKTLARLRKPESGGAKGYKDADALAVLSRLKALATVRANTQAGEHEYRARFGEHYEAERTDLAAISAKLDAFDELVGLRDMARDAESGVVWADLDAQGLEALFGSLYGGDAVAADWSGSIASCLGWASAYKDRANRLGVSQCEFARGIFDGGSEPLPEDVAEKCARWSQRLHDTVASCTDNQRWFSECFSDPRVVLDLPASDLAARADACVNDLKSLEHWSAYRREYAACMGLGLADYIDDARASGVSAEGLVEGFERSFWAAWLEWAEQLRSREQASLAEMEEVASARRLASSMPDLATRLVPCTVATPAVACAVFGEGDFMFDTAVVVEKGAPVNGDEAAKEAAAVEGLSMLARAHQTMLVCSR